jgi:hypothetical protein
MAWCPDRARLGGTVRRFDAFAKLLLGGGMDPWLLAGLLYLGAESELPLWNWRDARLNARAAKLLCVERICRGSR